MYTLIRLLLGASMRMSGKPPKPQHFATSFGSSGPALEGGSWTWTRWLSWIFLLQVAAQRKLWGDSCLTWNLQGIWDSWKEAQPFEMESLVHRAPMGPLGIQGDGLGWTGSSIAEGMVFVWASSNQTHCEWACELFPRSSSLYLKSLGRLVSQDKRGIIRFFLCSDNRFWIGWTCQEGGSPRFVILVAFICLFYKTHSLSLFPSG